MRFAFESPGIDLSVIADKRIHSSKPLTPLDPDQRLQNMVRETQSVDFTVHWLISL